jgi:hypothetical protein
VITRIKADKIPFYLVWIMGLLELITVPLVTFAPLVTGTAMKSPIVGAVIGIIGIVFLFACINKVLSRVPLMIFDHTLCRIHIVAPAVWSGLILGGIFVCQKIVAPVLHTGFPIREMVLGGISAGGTVLFVGIFYRLVIPWAPWLAMKMETSAEVLTIKRLSLWRWSAVAAIYEAAALPVIWAWKINPHAGPWWSIISGFAGGFAGAFILWVISHGVSVSLGWIDIHRTNKVNQ